MKKITLALCTCAFALTGILASCSSGSKDYIDLSETSSTYKYAVNGTIVTTSSNSYEDSSNKVTASSTTTTKKIDGGFVTVSWTENENRESNHDSYSIKGTVKSSATTTSSRTYDNKEQAGTTSSSSVGTTSLDLQIMDVDGDKYLLFKTKEITGYDTATFGTRDLRAGWYETWKLDYAYSQASRYLDPSDPSFELLVGYFLCNYGPVSTNATDPKYDVSQGDSSYVGGAQWVDGGSVGGFNFSEPVYGDVVSKTFKMDDIAASEDDDAFDGDFGDEFSINIKIDSKDEGLSYTKENSAKATNASSVEYKLTFVPVEDYDPEDFAEED